ncbi:MAG: tetraacyldisaccharide 4'-kinase [candidate division Zixibacteria bacterium]
MVILLMPFTLIYRIIIFFWDIYWRSKKPVVVPARVISVGGITVGGAGKTSVAGFIAQNLLSGGKDAIVVARGYKRLESGPVILTSETYSSWEACGDEPAALIKSFPGLTIYIDSDKTTAAKRASEDGREIIIIDDGFQHRKLKRDVDIVCLDGNNPFGNGFLMPSGRLREPKKSLRRADIIIVIDGPSDISGYVMDLPQGIPIFRGKKNVTSAVSFQGDTISLKGSKVLAFCGLGNPQSFRASLLETGCEVVELIEFADHYRYKSPDLERLVRKCSENNAQYIVTTLKDAVKLEKIWPRNQSLYYLEIKIELDRKDEFFRLINV